MSFRFDKVKCDDFGLTQSADDSDTYVDNSDNSKWVKKDLYDFGFGCELGFMRLPLINSMELWNLLKNSKLQENRYGAAHVLEKEYPEDLLKYLLATLNDTDSIINGSTIEILKILKLDIALNRCNILGRSIKEIEQDYCNWKFVSEKVSEILNQK